jgi:hypothetical protein
MFFPYLAYIFKKPRNMKNTRSFILATAMLCTGFLSANAQTADEVVEKHVNAVGGLDNWKKINSIIMTGIVSQGGTELPVTVTTLNGKGYRMEFSMNGIVNYQILTPTNGWAYFPAFGQPKPDATPPEEVKEQQDQLDVTMDPLIDYKTKGNTVTYLGKDQAEGTECHKIKVTHKNGKEETMFIDCTNYYCIRTVEKTKANGKEEESITTMGNFQKLPEGVVFPMSIESGGAPITLKTVEINKSIDESIFKPSENKK